MVTVAKISSSLGLFKSPRALFVSVSPSFLLVNSSYYSVYGKAPSCLSPTRWKCSKQPVLQYYYIAASHGSSLKAMENKISSLARPAIGSCWTSSGINRVPNGIIYSLTETAPFIKRVRLRQLRLLGHVLRLLETEPVREFAIYVLIHRSTPGRQRTPFTNYIHLYSGGCW